MQSAESISASRSYWTHAVDAFPSPVAQFRMAQLIDLDDRLYETARIVYRFLVGWYHDGHGDALLSQRHVAKVMKQRAPAGAAVPSRNAVQRAIIALMDAGWVVRTFQGRGKGKGASRYVPVLNVLEIAAQGKFPQPAHATGPVVADDELARPNGPVVAHATGPVAPELAHATGPKTLLLDPGTDPGTSNSNVSADPALAGLAAATPAAGFERIWNAYGKLGNKRASREAWSALVEPDVDLIVERAASWAASARPGQKRMPLEKWLAAEKFDEADRQVAPKERKAKDKPPEPVTIPANDNAPATGSPECWPAGEFVGQFVEGRVEEEARELMVTMSFRIDSPGEHFGRIHEHRFWLRAIVPSYQEKGQATMTAICRAVGLRDVDDTDLLLGRPIWASSDGETIAYRPLSEAEAA
jgi:hypothetical protein